jgi:predicted nucleotidyltransferase component of viral defense system
MSKAMQLKARIKNMALERHIPAQAVLQNFMLERLLERISLSQYKDRFVLKGGMLIASLVGIGSRTTMDMDATLIGYPLSEETIQGALSDICALQLDDGISLALEHIAPIRDEDEYGGYRVTILARYEAINTPLKIDITTGDIITPGAVPYTFHSSFENKLIEIWAYNIETILAEKVETILRRSVLNTRLRDFYDVYIILKTQGQTIDRDILAAALNATSERRMSLEALQGEEEIIQAIRADVVMKQRWERYCKEYYYANGIGFEDVIEVLMGIFAAH